MGVFDRFVHRNVNVSEARPLNSLDKIDFVVGAERVNDEKQIQSFNNKNFTFSGELSGYDYNAILRDKQGNIQKLYQLADYYTDSDAIFHGLIKHVFVPFTTCSAWYLTESKEKTCKMFEEYYKKMRLREKLLGIMLEYFKYGNVFTYFFKGQLITLPVDKCRIGNVALNGQPIVEYNCLATYTEWKMKGYSIKENWIKDNNIEVYFKGFPDEVRLGMNKGLQYVQLNPDNVFVMQMPKESWQRYAIPFIAPCLIPLSKKELISKYEDTILNLGIRSFVHVQYGDSLKGQDMLPTREDLSFVRKLFQQGMSGFPLVTTNHLAKATVIQPDTEDIFQWEKYKDVNNDILSAGGISGIIVSGVSNDGSTFASAQVSMQTAETRINAARDEFCELMNHVNERIVELIPGTYNLKQIPKFNFAPLDMTGKKALREACKDLWDKGVVSTRTMMLVNGFSIDIEKEKREKEKEDGTDKVLVPRAISNEKYAAKAASSGGSSNQSTQSTLSTGKVGRKKLDDTLRTSDPLNAIRSAQPKPSSPEGSGEFKQ